MKIVEDEMGGIKVGSFGEKSKGIWQFSYLILDSGIWNLVLGIWNFTLPASPFPLFPGSQAFHLPRK